MTESVIIALLVVGLPASAFRLWWIWWQSVCGDCGLQRSVCACGPGHDTMRPRR
jgi:hypothetical protein